LGELGLEGDHPNNPRGKAEGGESPNCVYVFIGSKIVQRQRQGFWLDITLGLGGLWAQKTDR